MEKQLFACISRSNTTYWNLFDMSDQKQIKPENTYSSALWTAYESSISNENFELIKRIFDEEDLSEAINEIPTAAFNNEVVEL